MRGRGRRRTRLSNEDIVAELRALVRRRLSEQVANAKETEAGFDKLPYEQRKELRDQISKRFPVKAALQPVPRDPHKKDKDTTTKRPPTPAERPRGVKD